MSHHDPLRRAFIGQASRLAMAGAAMPFGLNLAAIGQAAAFSATDYKALVCVFLYGGNDQANTVVAYDSANYERYRAIRAAGGVAGIAVARDSLAATRLLPAVPLPNGVQYALNPSMTALAGLFNGGQAAALLNVGPLIAPTTKAQYFSPDRQRYPLPPKLFSHNDQSSVWQASSPEGATRGWGGRLGDLALAANGQSMFTCISTTGSGVFVSGESSLRYQVTTKGAVPLYILQGGPLGATPMLPTVRELITEARDHVLENEYNRVVARSIAAQGQLTSALSGVAPLKTTFPAGSSLADELAVVARLIAARGALSVKRQVFLCSLGGFDHHDRLVPRLPGMLLEVSEAMASFYRATVELGIADQVTTFTASDFGRTLVSNGDGTDHGWGNHHLIVGGAVRGAAFYGTPPPISVGDTGAPEDQWHVGQGRLLPTTSVDQYAATLARWFGVSPTEQRDVVPNVVNFGGSQAGISYPVDLGFMRA